MTDNLVKVGRIAFREEGTMWNSYYAQPDTMEGAAHLGSIAMVSIRGNPTRKEDFIQLMRSVAGDILEVVIGAEPVWGGLEDAPEDEKAGHS